MPSDLIPTLRQLDRADRAIDPDSPRARADLARILSTERELTSPSAPRPRRTTRRILIAAAAVAVVTAGVVALPSVVGGDQAFATWTPVARGLSPAERTDAVDSCRTSQLDGPGKEYADQVKGADGSIVEGRGVWTSVLLTGDDGFSALCVTDSSRRLFDDWIGSIGAAPASSSAGSRQISATDLGTGSMGAGDISLAAGVVGSEVTGVTYTSPDGVKVRATVANEHFLFWLPGDALMDAASDGVEVTLTYRDGTTGRAELRL